MLDGEKFFRMVKYYDFMVEILESGVEVKKLDAQGRLILPSDWREAEISESREVYVIKRKGYLKLIPKRRVDLTKCFDKVDLGVKSIGKWSDFEKKKSMRNTHEIP